LDFAGVRGFVKVKPTVLVATTTNWFSTARLALALSNAGCIVKAVCPPRHPVGKTTAVSQLHVYNGLAPLASFADAIAAAKPDLIVPSDDLATRHLHELFRQQKRHGKAGASFCALVERSLGAPESFPIVYARTAFIKLAQEEGIRAPKSEVITNIDELRRWIAQTGLPTVLKANDTSGGGGVRIVRTLEEAERAFQALGAPPSLARTTKHALLDGDSTLVWPMLLRRRSVVNGQVFIPGREATSLVACWKGTVLASLHFEVLNKQDSTGPASVLRRIEDADMSRAAEKVVRRLNLSGLHGFDFMLEAGTGDAHLIEINPRATQVGHLTLGPGHDLPAALCAAMSGSLVHEAMKLTENDTIALFPQEWTRNPESVFLQSGYHDVPWEEPELIRACLRRSWKWRSWRSRRKSIRAFAEVHRARL